MKTMTTIAVFLSCIALFSVQVSAKDLNLNNWILTEQLDKNTIHVELFKNNKTSLRAFKVSTHIKAPLDRILAVMLDNHSCFKWFHGCKYSNLIERVNFNEQYHYQVIDIPFPFKDRDIIFHTIMDQDPVTKQVTINIFSTPDYCKKMISELCKKINHSRLVRVKKSVGVYQLKPNKSGTDITWIQYTDPSGNLPAWLVNQFVKDTPYWTMVKLTNQVKQKKYQQARLIYNAHCIAIDLDYNQKKSIIAAK